LIKSWRERRRRRKERKKEHAKKNVNTTTYEKQGFKQEKQVKVKRGGWKYQARG
jgi:hypothetical protein